MDILVDFRSIQQENIGEKKLVSQNKYSNFDFDDTTCLYYKSHRIQKTDPITFDDLMDTNAFKFYNMWDPYTGKRIEVDPYGPIYLNPITLLHHFYQYRLNNLWIDQSDEADGVYTGYYGDGVGAGEDFEVIGRGIYPEKYLFRLPIPNCYLKKKHDMSLITMGPKLTDDEISHIDNLITKYWKHDMLYKKIYNKIGSLKNLKYYYDIAISKNPTKMDLCNFNNKIVNEIMSNPNEYLNRKAVDIIKGFS